MNRMNPSTKNTKIHQEEITVARLLPIVCLLAACQTAPMPALIPTATDTARANLVATATVPASPTWTPTITPTAEPAWHQSPDPSFAILKYKYAQVNSQKARVYTSRQDASGNTGNFGLLPSYPAYVAYTTKESEGGRDYYLTNLGWMKGEDLQELTPSTFAGILLTREVPFRFGWVLADSQSVDMTNAPVRAYQRYQVVHEVPATAQKPGFIAIGADEWLPAEALAMVTPAVPAEAGQNICRFIYVDLSSQTLSVFDQCKLVFATLVSSGRNSWTFEGKFAIQYKVEYGSITPPAGSTSEYYIEGLPYFMTYSGDFGFHGAYWHDAFGTAASHGCINLAPADARWLYEWAGIGERVIVSKGTS